MNNVAAVGFDVKGYIWHEKNRKRQTRGVQHVAHKQHAAPMTPNLAPRSPLASLGLHYTSGFYIEMQLESTCSLTSHTD